MGLGGLGLARDRQAISLPGQPDPSGHLTMLTSPPYLESTEAPLLLSGDLTGQRDLGQRETMAAGVISLYGVASLVGNLACFLEAGIESSCCLAAGHRSFSPES